MLDAALLTVLVIGIDVEIGRLSALVAGMLAISVERIRFVIVTVAGLIAVPLIYGVITSARSLGLHLARRAFADAQSGKVDPADAPRRALVIVIQIAVVLAVGIPVVAITQPFLPANQGAFVLALLTLLLLAALWRNAANLQGHARAGAQIIASALADQMASSDGLAAEPRTLDDINAILPGLGEPVAIRVAPESIAAGKSLAQINLRGLKCPLPALRARKTLSGMASGDVLVVECTDPLSAIDIPNLTRQTGDHLEDSSKDDKLLVFRIRKK